MSGLSKALLCLLLAFFFRHPRQADGLAMALRRCACNTGPPGIVTWYINNRDSSLPNNRYPLRPTNNVRSLPEPPWTTLLVQAVMRYITTQRFKSRTTRPKKNLNEKSAVPTPQSTCSAANFSPIQDAPLYATEAWTIGPEGWLVAGKISVLLSV